jgi:hypothetical protein
MIQSARLAFEDYRTVVFAKSCSVVLCPACDTAPRRKRDTLHPPT